MMSRRPDGQVTVFMALLFMVVVSLLMAQYRSALFYARRADAERAAALSVSSLLAQYQQPLRDYYHILSVDGGFGRGIFQEELLEEELLTVFDENLETSLGMNSEGNAHMDEPIFTMLIDSDWDFFLREISMDWTDALISEGIQYIMSQWQNKKDGEVLELNQKQAEAETAQAETQSGERKKKEIYPPILRSRSRIQETLLWKYGIREF